MLIAVSWVWRCIPTVSALGVEAGILGTQLYLTLSYMWFAASVGYMMPCFNKTKQED